MDHRYYRRGEVLFSLGRYEEAEREFALALTGDASDASAHRVRALCFYNLWQLAKAEAEAKEALALEPDNAANHYTLAICIVEQTDAPDWLRHAEAVVQEALRLSPEDADAWSLLARLRLLEQRWAEAEAAATNGLRHDPCHLPCQIQRGYALMMMKAMAEAEIAAREALATAPESSAAHSLLGQVLLNKNDSASSERSFLEALRLEPDRIAAHQGLNQARRGWRSWTSSNNDAGVTYDPRLDNSRPRHGPNCAFLADHLRRNRAGALDWLLEKGIRMWIWLPPGFRAKGRNDIVSFTRMLTYTLFLLGSVLVMASVIATTPSTPIPPSPLKKALMLSLAAGWLAVTVAAFWFGGHCKNYLERKLALARWQFSAAQIK